MLLNEVKYISKVTLLFIKKKKIYIYKEDVNKLGYITSALPF